MAANPQLTRTPDSQLAPAPFPNETIALARKGVEIWLDSLQTPKGRWTAKGTLWLTDVRLVFVAPQPESSTGLQAFDLPLCYIAGDKFNQPIFGCNHLSGRVWPAVENGGPSGTLPPHDFKLYFKEGGVGTFLPLYHRFLQTARVAAQQAQPVPSTQSTQPSAPEMPQSLVATALVDPSDPSQVFLCSPVGEETRLHEAPKYAANYGADEKYEPL